MQNHKNNNDILLLIAFLLSGLSGLGYEILWTKLLGLSLGSETVAVYGVLAGYFGGMSLGAFLFRKRVKTAKHPALWYVCFEIIVAVYASIIPFIFAGMPSFLPMLLNSIVGQNISVIGLGISFTVAGILFLPATICLGATLPALVEARRRIISTDNDGRGLGRLYGANTAGATVGIFVTVYTILPRFGMLKGSFLLALCSLGAAFSAWGWHRKHETSHVEANADEIKDEITTGEKSRVLLILAFATGFAGIAFEVVGAQILSQVFRNTIYTFANILGIFLVGSAIGAWFYSIFVKKAGISFSTTLGILLAGLTFSVTLAAFPLANSLAIAHSIAPLAGSSFIQHLAAELAVACLIFLVPTIFMGALFSHIVSQFTEQGIGKAVAINTLGATIAPILFALIFIGSVGYTGSFYIVAGTYFVIFSSVVILWKLKPLITVVSYCIIIVAGILAPKDCVILNVKRGQKIVKRYEGIMGQVMVLEDRTTSYERQRNRYLQVDRFYTMGGGDVITEKRQVYMPLLLTPGKGRILFLGVGTGIFVNSARVFDFDTIDAVEIVPEIIEALDYFSSVNNRLSKAKNVNFYCSDARRFVSATKNTYDVIFGDLFHPSRPGASFLLTCEHFKTIKSRLTEEGFFIQFIPLYQYDTATLKVVMRTFHAVFPKCHALLGRNAYRNIMILVGSKNDKTELSIPLNTLQGRIESNTNLCTIVHNPVSLFSYYLFDSKGISDFAGRGSLNKDLHPLIMFNTSKLAYKSVAAERVASLSALLNKKKSPPETMVTDPSDEKLRHFRNETGRFGMALTSFIKAEVLTCTSLSTKKRPEEAIELYVQAYEYNPVFALNQGIPFMLSPDFKQYHKKIFPRLIAATPHLKWLYIDYLGYLNNVVHDMEMHNEIYKQAAPIFGGEDSLNMVLQSTGMFKKGL